MPKDFTECQKAGGRIRTKQLSDGRYIKICYDSKGSHAGEVHEKRGEKLKKMLWDKKEI